MVAALEFPRALAADGPLDPRSLAEIQRLLNAGNTQRAEEMATALVAASTNSYEAYETLGRVMDAEGQYQKAETAYQQAMKLAPSAASPHISLGVSLVRRGLTTEALKQFQAALTADPQNLTA